MMTRKEILQLSKLVNEAKKDCSVLSTDDIAHLEDVLQTELDIRQAYDFRDYIHNLPKLFDGEDKSDKLLWQISIGNSLIRIRNSSRMQQMFFDLIDEYIEYEL